MKLFLNGGGSTKELALTMSKVNEVMDHSKPILYVPLAMDETDHPYNGCYDWFQKQITNVDVVGVDMPRTFEQFASFDFNNYSAIFIGGGNTYKLLKGIKDNGIFEKINEYLNNDGIVIGCSAGAIIFGYDINSCLAMDRNDVNLIDTKGFNKLGGKSVFAHYTNSKTEEIHKKYTEYLINYSTSNETVIALPEEDTILIDNEKEIIFGTRPYYEFENGIKNKKYIDNSIVIRKVTPNDARKWFLFGFKVWRDAYKDIFPEEVFIDRESSLEEKVKEFNNKLQNNDRSIAYVAEYKGELIGTMCGSISSSYNHFEKYADLIGLYVDPRFQGYGIGTLLRNTFENWAIENGATQYVIGVLKDNIKARKVYESWGGKLSEFEEDFVKLGVGYPEVFYTYDLQNVLKKQK